MPHQHHPHHPHHPHSIPSQCPVLSHSYFLFLFYSYISAVVVVISFDGAGDYDGEDTNITFDDFEYLLQYGNYEGDEANTFGDVRTSLSFGSEEVEASSVPATALVSAQGLQKEGGGMGPLPISILGSVV